jgi:hypothetical protein
MNEDKATEQPATRKQKEREREREREREERIEILAEFLPSSRIWEFE